MEVRESPNKILNMITNTTKTLIKKRNTTQNIETKMIITIKSCTNTSRHSNLKRVNHWIKKGQINSLTQMMAIYIALNATQTMKSQNMIKAISSSNSSKYQ